MSKLYSFISVCSGIPQAGVVCAALVCMISSCTSQRLQDTARFNVEFTEPITNVSKCSSKDADSVLSIYAAREPILVPETSLSKAICRILVVSPCEQERLLPTIIEVPASLIKRVSDLSTPLAPPRKLKPLERTAYRSLAPCCRERSGVGLFDKLELRLAAGYRGAADSVLYPSNAGTVVYRSSLIGFDRGGSSILGGFEVSGLWSIPEIDTSKHLQAGVIAGILPTDGSTFVPVGGHVRYTFRQRPVDEFDPLLADYFTCNSVYLFAQAGVPIDWQTGAPYWGGTWQHQRYFWGVGIGYDIALSCGLDFSIDIGVRQMNLPLPAVDCCSTRFGDMRHPFRASTALLLRLGLTF